MKKTIEALLLTFVMIIALWLGAFLLRDRSELFCKVSLGKYQTSDYSKIPTVGNIAYKKVCIGSLIVKVFGK